MVGVSTGSIIVALLAFQKLSVDEVSKIYLEIGAEVFSQTYIKAVTGMVRSQAYYDTSKYESILKQFAGEDTLASTLQDAECPRVAIVSAIMSSSRHSVTPFVFRNYAMPHKVTSNYRGDSGFKIWEAVRASSAAPGFFDDFSTHGQVFQDGGIIANNPSSIGYHEARHLWPTEDLQCLVIIIIHFNITAMFQIVGF
jgi:calcium-independent phospholipase A2-gamma